MFVNYAHSAVVSSGKTEYVLDLLQGEYSNFFKYVIIICPTWRYNKAYLKRKWLFNNPEHIFLVDPNELLPKSDDSLNDTLKIFFEHFGKLDDSHVLFLIDDCSSQKGMTKRKECY
ncbi:unnamed protein product, partial [marine sediment metagenome]